MTVAELYRRVYERPDDRDARAVLADALLEAGEAHGELIALQLDGARDHEERLETLLADAPRFLGPLTPLIADVVIKDGFAYSGRLLPAACTLEAAQWLEWGTLRHLDVALPMDNAATLLFAPALRNLRSLSLRFAAADTNALGFLQTAPTLPWETLILRTARDAHATALASMPALGQLRRVHAIVFGLAHGVAWLRARPALPATLADLVIDGYGWRCAWSRGALTLEASLPDGVPALDAFVDAGFVPAIDLSRMVGLPVDELRAVEKKHRRLLVKK